MAWEKPKTDWQTGDAPTADAFNRIEKNILDLKDNKRDKSSTVPVANGGTGAGDASAARKKPLRFFAEAFAVLSFTFYRHFCRGSAARALTPQCFFRAGAKSGFLPARTRRAYNDYPAPVR